MNLRPYQETAIASALGALANSGSAVLQMPTGGGKTRVAGDMILRAEGPIWFVCHRQEIERQAAKAFAVAGIDFGIVSPRAEPEYDKPVQIVSVGTLARRLADLPAPKLVIWDECHHVAAASWAKIRNSLPDAQHLGLTATPERLDGKGLKDWFADLIVGPSTRELIDDGYLSEFRYFAPSDPDLAAAKLQAGDYKKGDMAKVMNTPVLIGDAVSEYKAKASGKRAIVFCASVEASKALVDRFNAEGIAAAHVDGTTPTDVRDRAVIDLTEGGIKILSNVEVFTEGFDLPAIDAVILMRPTKSLSLFLQMIGRALRNADGKNEALIFDHAGLWLDHGWFDLPIEWSIDGGARKRRLASMGDGRLRRCPSCKEVRAERAETCRCGYEFPTGREVGEYDGQLYELRSALPDGLVTRAEFGRSLNSSWTAVKYWIGMGMPTAACGNIEPSAARTWLKDNPPTQIPPIDSQPGEYVTKAEFSRITGYGWGVVGTMQRAGIPHKGNWIHKEDGLTWIKTKWRPTSSHQVTDKNKDGLMTAAELSRHFGVGHGLISKLKRDGMPAEHSVLFNLGVVLEWIKTRNSQRIPPLFLENHHEYEPQIKFANRIGFSAMPVDFVKRGIPHAPNGWVHITDGERWFRENYKNSRRRPIEGAPGAFESKASFGKRLGFAGSTAPREWTRRGLPTASNGWVHIQRGLEWVRDNTSIAIPPEAWPAANDNAEDITREMHAEARDLLAGKTKRFGGAA